MSYLKILENIDAIKFIQIFLIFNSKETHTHQIILRGDDLVRESGCCTPPERRERNKRKSERGGRLTLRLWILLCGPKTKEERRKKNEERRER
jgi:hypothetical protein